MSDSEKKSFGSFLALINRISALTKLFSARKTQKITSNLLKQSVTLTALAIFLAPAIACAEPFLILHNEGITSQASETVRPAIKHSLTVGLNDNGDLMLRHKDVSLILAYNPPNDIIEPQERLRIAQRQDSPAISGISLKVTVLF